ncbi:MAG: agmatinase [Flavobacteriia bacterium]|nr:agmatinase [Flavobacteriia bacterium]NBV91468.1 agmatinase [Flavobacteriia bacterium]NBY39800.1 agmatinase [Flavobacteriia bacterium]
MTFDPNGVGQANGNVFGFPKGEETADIIIIPVPWDVTASYAKGTSRGPQAILDASTQLDFFHSELPKAYETKVHLTPISEEWLKINDTLNDQSRAYFEDLETLGETSAMEKHAHTIESINEFHAMLTVNLQERALELLEKNKICAVLGGEHSTPFGLIHAIDKTYKNYSILQIDAHADMRESYEGFKQSHASIMFNVVHNCKNLGALVQVGIRDLSEMEMNEMQANEKIKTHFDWNLKKAAFLGVTWDATCDKIINDVTEDVYVSFDIDGLEPSLCPNTGTPVPGGLTLAQVRHLLFKMVDAGKRIIGFDLNEVAPGTHGDWDANVGARALWELVCATEKSRKNHV